MIIQLSDYLWKQISPFSNFLKINWLSMLYFVYCNFLCSDRYYWTLLKQPCLRRKCVAGLQILEKNLNFSRCMHLWNLVLKSCSDIHERSLIELPFIFTELVIIIASFASLVGMSLFHFWVTCQVEIFSYCTFTETFANGF